MRRNIKGVWTVNGVILATIEESDSTSVRRLRWQFVEETTESGMRRVILDWRSARVGMPHVTICSPISKSASFSLPYMRDMVAIGSGCGVWLGPATNSVKRVSTRPRDASRRVVGVAFHTPIELRFGNPELISLPSSASPCFPNFSSRSLTYHSTFL